MCCTLYCEASHLLTSCLCHEISPRCGHFQGMRSRIYVASDGAWHCSLEVCKCLVLDSFFYGLSIHSFTLDALFEYVVPISLYARAVPCYSCSSSMPRLHHLLCGPSRPLLRRILQPFLPASRFLAAEPSNPHMLKPPLTDCKASLQIQIFLASLKTLSQVL